MKLYAKLVPNDDIGAEWFSIACNEKECLNTKENMSIHLSDALALYTKVYSNKGNARRAMNNFFKESKHKIEWIN